MNYPLLKEALKANEILFKGHLISISIEKLPLWEQKEFLDTILSEGQVICKVKIPEKSTEEVVAYFIWEGEGCYLSIGHFRLPSQRKSSKQISGMDFLVKDIVKSLLSKESDNLQYTNKSLLTYVLSIIPDTDAIVLENGTWNTKATKPLPEKYDCMDKILTLMRFKK